MAIAKKTAAPASKMGRVFNIQIESGYELECVALLEARSSDLSIVDDGAPLIERKHKNVPQLREIFDAISVATSTYTISPKMFDPSRSRIKNSPYKDTFPEDYSYDSEYLHLNVAKKRVIFLKDMASTADLELWLYGLVDPDDCNIRQSYSRLVTKAVLVEKVLIEGIHFNLDKISQALTIVSDIGNGQYCFSRGKFYISSEAIKNLFHFTIAPLQKEAGIDRWLGMFTKTARDSVKELKERADELRRSMVEAQTNLGKARFVLKSLESGRQVITDQIKEIEKIPHIESVHFIKAGVVARTTDIWVDFKGGKLYLGVYEILFTFKGLMKIRNLKMLLGKDRLHPHCFSGGEMCLGGYEDLLGSSLSMFDYYTVFLVAVEYINSLNEKDGLASNAGNYFSDEKKPDSAYYASSFVNLLDKPVSPQVEGRPVRATREDPDEEDEADEDDDNY